MTGKQMHVPAVGYENFEDIINKNDYFIDKSAYLENLLSDRLLNLNQVSIYW